MKQLTDTERLRIALFLLIAYEGLDEYNRLCTEREQDCERNGFHNVPAECGGKECSECTMQDELRRDIDCPYVN